MTVSPFVPYFNTNGTPTHKGIEYFNRLETLVAELEANLSGDIKQAEAVVLSTYGDTVSVSAKAKNLNKFGRNRAVGTSPETVAEFQGSTANEAFLTTNGIDAISSSDAADTQTVRIEGHTIDGSGNLTFAVQTATLTGTTPVALSTPLARATRASIAESGVFGSPPAALAGTVYIYDDTDGQTGGVPDTDAATKILMTPGDTNTEKCATSISSSDYWFISDFSAGVGSAGGSAARVTLTIERRDVANGGPWLPFGREIVLTIAEQNPAPLKFAPFLIVPPNHDVRVVANTNSNTAEVFAELSGYLAAIQ